ncbi:hypothetical protein F2P56_024919, partial [Juglans regia]
YHPPYSNSLSFKLTNALKTPTHTHSKSPEDTFRKMAKATVAVGNKDKTLHPPYFEMISEAILTLKDRTGSSQQAIAKFAEEKYKKVLPPNFKKVLSVQLKRFVKSERLVKIKNSFKVSSTEKVKLAVKEKETHKKKDNSTKTRKAVTPKKIAEKKGVKTKRLSQVKTPEKNPKKIKKKSLTPIKRKAPKPQGSSRPAKKSRN